MKTTIIQLETHDDIISIREKIEWCTSQRIILVFPKKLKQVPNVLELRLIKRTAIAKGAQVALVTRDLLLSENADEVGVPVFHSIPLAQRGNWFYPSLQSESRTAQKGIDAILEERDLIGENLRTRELNPVIRIIVFLLALAALVAMAVFILPTAQITVFPVAETQSITLKVSASPQAESVSITGVIPAAEHSFSLTLEKTAPSSGTTVLGQSRASGDFLVNNLTQGDLVLPTGTIFSINGDIQGRFATIKEINLSAGATGIVVETEALLPGEEGNIAAGTPAFVEGIYGSMVDAIAADNFSNGSSSTLPAPTDEDYDNLRQEMLDELSKTALEYLEQMESETEKAIPETLALEEILMETRVNPVGEPSDTFTLKMNVQFRAFVYDPRDITKLMGMILDSNLQKGYHSIGNDIVIEKIGGVENSTTGSAEWQVQGTRLVVKDWGSDRIRTLIKGKTTSEALAILDVGIPHTKSAITLLNPKFWPRLPLLPSQIHIEENITQ